MGIVRHDKEAWGPTVALSAVPLGDQAKDNHSPRHDANATKSDVSKVASTPRRSLDAILGGRFNADARPTPLRSR
jgi:hypothetical protein